MKVAVGRGKIDRLFAAGRTVQNATAPHALLSHAGRVVIFSISAVWRGRPQRERRPPPPD